ncbi:hypothetical protein EV1_039921 [Malus domestica]
MPRRRMKEKTFKWNTEYGPPQCLPRSGMTDQPEDFPISYYGKSDLIREVRRERSLQRRLDMEYSTPKNGYAREMRETSSKKEPVIPVFPLLEEKRDKGKNKEGSRANQLVLEEILESELPDPLLFPLDSRG